MTMRTADADRGAIRAHIDHLFTAFIRKDRDAIRCGHTTDWQGFQVHSGRIVRGIDEYMRAVDVVLADFEFERYEILEIDIQLHGDVATVYYVAQDWWQDRSGVRRSGRVRAVDVYRREAGGWNQCGSNICAVPESTA